MPKNIILLSDGTGNSSRALFKTNVWRLYQALDLDGLAGTPKQIAHYDDGVGTSSFKPLAIIGGAFGYGVKRIVLDLYIFLSRNYEPGDQIYCFGFSRGAFIVRVLAALIESQGLILGNSMTEAERQRLAREAFRGFRRCFHERRNSLNPYNVAARFLRILRDLWLFYWNKWRGKAHYLEPKQRHDPDPANIWFRKWSKHLVREWRSWLTSPLSKWNNWRSHLKEPQPAQGSSPTIPPNWLNYLMSRFRQWFRALKAAEAKTFNPKPPRDGIAFLGVWDTVAAYGLPIDELTRAWDAIFPIAFPEHGLGTKIKQACHALALDDERHSFHPELWTEKEKKPEPDETPEPSLHDRLLQVWFAGMHSDVGGSYPDDAMSFVPLDFMMKQAERSGLHFKAQERANIKAAANLRGPIHDSRRGTGGFYRYRPRKLADLCEDKMDKGDIIRVRRPKIHLSVFERIKTGTDNYAPIVLPARYAVYVPVDDGDEIHWIEGEQHQCEKFQEEGPPKKIELAVAPESLPELESTKDARRRVRQQAQIWNLVWTKRMVYFLTLATSAILAAFPLKWPAGGCQEWLCSVSPAINLVGMFLPGLLAPWINAFASHPSIFLTIFAVLVVLLKISDQLQRKIFDRMRALWRASLQLAAPSIPPTATTKVSWQEALRKKWQPIMRWISVKVVVPFFSILVSVLLVIGLARVVFTVLDSTGKVCKYAADTPRFESRQVCWNSHAKVEAGKYYQVTIALEKEPWRDASIPATLRGFGSEQFPGKTRYIAPAFVLLRRHLTEPWFKPILRIGASGQDNYPLDVAPLENSSTVGVAKFQARSSGEVFLYVNDAVLPVLNGWQRFYQNNHGAACVEIKELPSP